MYGYDLSGTEMRTYRGGVSIDDIRSVYRPERLEAYGHKPLVSPKAHPHHGTHTGRRPFGGEVLNIQPTVGVSPLGNQYAATSPETSDKYCAYSGTFSSQAIASGYGPTGYIFQESINHRSQECGIPDLVQAGSEPISHPRQRYADRISPYGSNTDWRPSVSPNGQMPASSNDALNFRNPEISATCANCQNHPHMNAVSVYYPDKGDVSWTTDWRSPGAKNHILRPTDESVPLNRELPTHGTRRIAPHNDRHDVPLLEQHKSRFPRRKSAPTNAPDNSVTTHANEDSANNGLIKKRKRKPRTIKPRKPRTLTNEGKAHAKAVRESPGGACADCKRKKTKCTHKLPQDKAMGPHDKLTPNTPWTEPPTPDNGLGDQDPVFYRSSQENDISYADMDEYSL